MSPKIRFCFFCSHSRNCDVLNTDYRTQIFHITVGFPPLPVHNTMQYDAIVALFNVLDDADCLLSLQFHYSLHYNRCQNDAGVCRSRTLMYLHLFEITESPPKILLLYFTEIIYVHRLVSLKHNPEVDVQGIRLKVS